MATKPSVKIGKPRPLFVGSSVGVRRTLGFDVAPSDDKFLALGPATNRPTTIGIIQNWSAEFVKRPW